LEQLATKVDIAELRWEIKFNRWLITAVFAAQVLPMLKVFFSGG